jgi:hypothetical protein
MILPLRPRALLHWHMTTNFFVMATIEKNIVIHKVNLAFGVIIGRFLPTLHLRHLGRSNDGIVPP